MREVLQTTDPIVLSANSSWNIVNFRSGLIRRLVAHGHRVVVIAPIDESSSGLAVLGAEHRPIKLNRSGLSPIEDGAVLVAYFRLLRELRPAAYLGFTAKPNIYGSLAARFLGIRVINNISGLGTAFMARGPLQFLVSRLYRLALARSATVFFQNPDDRAMFVERRLVTAGQARLLAGSGIDLDRFAPRSAVEGNPLRFLLVARMLRDKGVVEFVDAARILRREGRAARFALLGPADGDNRTAISPEQLTAWADEGVIDYLGAATDVRPFVADADCVVLPSYREGLPRSLIEAAAMAKPVITTDVPGCRAAIDAGETGLLCAARSAPSLAAAMAAMIDLGPDRRRAMGEAGRRKAEREFDERLVGDAYLAALERRSGHAAFVTMDQPA